MDEYHIPVLSKEAIWYLDVRSGRRYIDATLGGGGHTAGVLKAGGKVLGIDQDVEAISYVRNFRFSIFNFQNLTLRQGNFAHLKEIAASAGFHKVAGILFDLGVSSHQLEMDYRGFSFGKTGKLDMRMDQSRQQATAADLVNAGGEQELAGLFYRYGEERDSRRVAKAIVAARKHGRIETTDQLAEIVLKSTWRGKGISRTHPATKVFQALRIAVNDELASLEVALPQASELLEVGGRLVIISFHSLDDRIVKRFYKTHANELHVLTDKPVRASREEIQKNPRARSGKLRAAERL